MPRKASEAKGAPGRAAGTRRYRPRPADTSRVEVPPGVGALTELLARNTHENWARQRLSDGWRWGPARDDARREHPCLVPYEALPEEEREYDRRTALETVRLILALGYRIVSPPAEAPQGRGGGRRPAASPSPSRPGCARRTRS